MSTPSFKPAQGLSNKLLRPLPRKRIERFVWQWPDTVWVAITAISCLAFSGLHAHSLRSIVGVTLAVLCAEAAYVGGLKMHSRAAGVAAALLIATSRLFSDVCVVHPSSAAVACTVVVAVASYGVGWEMVTYSAACLAFTQGFNGALLGLVICAVLLVQKREHAVAGLIGFAAFALLWSLAISPLHLPSALRPWQSWSQARTLTGMSLLLLWFLVPFWAEATLKGATERWLLTLAMFGGLIVTIFTSTTAITPQLYIAFPLSMLIVGVGLGRLIPAIAGDYPSVSKRYLAASAAVAATLLLRLYVDPRTDPILVSMPPPAASQHANAHPNSPRTHS